jgi:hypothetical protein
MTSPLVKSASEAMSEKPDVTYADIGGMATWKEIPRKVAGSCRIYGEWLMMRKTSCIVICI